MFQNVDSSGRLLASCSVGHLRAVVDVGRLRVPALIRWISADDVLRDAIEVVRATRQRAIKALFGVGRIAGWSHVRRVLDVADVPDAIGVASTEHRQRRCALFAELVDPRVDIGAGRHDGGAGWLLPQPIKTVGGGVGEFVGLVRIAAELRCAEIDPRRAVRDGTLHGPLAIEVVALLQPGKFVDDARRACAEVELKM